MKRRPQPRIPLLVIAGIGTFAWLGSYGPLDAAEDYRVQQNGNNIELVTPYGKKVLFGENGLNGSRDYRIEIPMSDIKPAPTPTAPPPNNITINQVPPLPAMPQPSETPGDGYRSMLTPTPNATPSPSPDPTPTPTPSPTPSPTASPTPVPTAAPSPSLPNPMAGYFDTYDDTDKLIVEANYLYNKGRFYDATVVMESVLRRRPRYVRGWIMKGSLMYVQGHKDLAKTAWEKALELDTDNREVKELLMRVK